MARVAFLLDQSFALGVAESAFLPASKPLAAPLLAVLVMMGEFEH
jgi:hypothetical protein